MFVSCNYPAQKNLCGKTFAFACEAW